MFINDWFIIINGPAHMWKLVARNELLEKCVNGNKTVISNEILMAMRMWWENVGLSVRLKDLVIVKTAWLDRSEKEMIIYSFHLTSLNTINIKIVLNQAAQVQLIPFWSGEQIDPHPWFAGLSHFQGKQFSFLKNIFKTSL